MTTKQPPRPIRRTFDSTSRPQPRPFAVLFAVYAVLGRNYAAGPSGADLFDLKLVAASTGVLLLSSITYGFAMIGMLQRKQSQVLGWLAVTGALGLGFLGMEVYEFAHLIGEGAGPHAPGPSCVATAQGRGHARIVRDEANLLRIGQVQVRMAGEDPAEDRRTTASGTADEHGILRCRHQMTLPSGLAHHGARRR